MMHNAVTLLLAAPVPPVPFDPRPREWIVFAVCVGIIIVIYIMRYLASNRKTHQYITHTDAKGPSQASSSDAKP
jgi:hypothetical protein